MIKAKELRIGSKLQTVKDKTLLTVAGLVQMKEQGTTAITFVEGIGNYTTSSAMNDVEPVPLTSEILEKCFKKDEHGIHLKNAAYLKVEIGLKQAHLSIPGEDNYQITYMNCEFLHQLQNLYYVLAAEELEVNL